MAVTASAGTLNFTVKVTDESKGAVKSISAGIKGAAGAHDDAADSADGHAKSLAVVGSEAANATTTLRGLWAAFAGAKDATSATKDVEDALAHFGGTTLEAATAAKVVRAALSSLGQNFSHATAEMGIAGEVLKDFGMKGIIAGAAVLAVGDYVKDAVESFAEFQAMGIKLNANLAAIGQQGKITLQDLDDMGHQLSKTTIFNPDQIIQAGTQLSQFASMSRDQIKELIPVVLDFAAATGQTASGAAHMLGQALNDPVRGMMLLERQLRNVTAADREKITQDEASGNMDAARAVLIQRVTERYQGQAEALSQGLSGSFEDAAKSGGVFFEDISRWVGSSIADALDLQDAFHGVASAFQALDNLVPSMDPVTSMQQKLLVAKAGVRGHVNQGEVQQYQQQLKNMQEGGQFGAGQSSDMQKAIDDANQLAVTFDEFGQKAITAREHVSEIQKALADLAAQKDTLSKNPVLSGSQLAQNRSDTDTLTTALQRAQGVIAEMRTGMQSFADDTQVAIAKAGMLGGQQKLYDDQIDAAKAYAKDHPGNYLDDLNNPTVVTAANQRYSGELGGDINKIGDQNSILEPYARNVQTSRGTQSKQLAKDMYDAVKQALGEAVYSKAPDSQFQQFVKANLQTQKLDNLTATGSGNSQDAAQKPFNDLTDQVAEAAQQLKAMSGGLSSEQAKSAADVWKTALDASREGAISFTAALAEATSLTRQKSALDAQITVRDQQSKASDVQAQVAALFSGGKGAEDRVTAQQSARDQGLQAGSPSFNDYVSASLTTQKVDQAKALESTYQSLTEQNQAMQEQLSLGGDTTSMMEEHLAIIKLTQQANDANLTTDEKDALLKAQAKNYDLHQQVSGQSNTYADYINDTDHKGLGDATWQSAATDGLSKSNDLIVAMVEGTERFNQGIKEVARSVETDLLGALTKTLTDNLVSSIFGGATNSSGGSNSGLLGGLFSGIDGLLGLAGGANSGSSGGTGGHVSGNGTGSAAAGGGFSLGGLTGGIGSIFSTGKDIASFAGGAMSYGSEALNWASSFFADGGIMTPQGKMPLRKYATGGVAHGPQVAVYGEGKGHEAYVPLPDGRSIPVTMRGGGGGGSSNMMSNAFNVTVNMNGSSGNGQPGDTAQQTGTAVAAAIRNNVTSMMIDQQRIGGVLNSTLPS